MSELAVAVEIWRAIEPIATPVAISAAGGAVHFVGKKISKKVDRVHNKQMYMYIKQEAMDKALEHEFNNGYGPERDKQMQKLMEKHNFIEGK